MSDFCLSNAMRLLLIPAVRHDKWSGSSGARSNARLMRLGRPDPDLPASLLFEPDEITAAYVLNNKPMPKDLPTINDVARRIAMLGGFLARKGDGETDVRTLWIGM